MEDEGTWIDNDSGTQMYGYGSTATMDTMNKMLKELLVRVVVELTGG